MSIVEEMPGNKILIVEDDKFLRGLIASKLAKEGFEVVEAADGEDGVKKIPEAMPNLVLLDLLLPGIDGFEVLKQVKAIEAVKNIPVIILSNLGAKEDIEKGLSLGAIDFMVKAHFTPEEIIEKVRTSTK